MQPWAFRSLAILMGIGLVLSIALSSALPIVLAVCIGGVIAATQLHSRR